MMNSKKAQVFSLIAVLMSALFVMIFTGGSGVALDRDVKTTETAITTTSQFIDDLNGFIAEGSRTSGRMILHDLVIYHNNSNNFTDFTRSVEDCFLNGSFKQNYSSNEWEDCSQTHANLTFDEVMGEVYELAEDTYGLTIEQHNTTVDVSQTSPYELRFDVTTAVNATKEKGGVGTYGWNRIITTTAYVSIIGLPDPLSRDTPYERNITTHHDIEPLQARTSNIDGDTELLAEFIDNEYFIIDPRAPNFIQMLEGTISPEDNHYTQGENSYGITSYLNETFYADNQTSMEEYRYKRITFQPDDLRRIDSSDVSGEILFEEDSLYALNITSTKDVKGKCDDDGCQ